MRLVKAGERGFDRGFSYPSPEAVIAAGLTFWMGYISPNPKKNIPKSLAHEYYDAGLAGWLIWEVNAGRANLGAAAGHDDGLAALTQAHILECEWGVSVIAANDTDTTAINLPAEQAYMGAFRQHTEPQYPLGMYDDTDLAAVVPFSFGHLPNAYGWSAPTKSVAVAKAKALGYHMIQGRLTDDLHEPSYLVVDGLGVDLNHCIRDCYGWGKAQPTHNGEEDMQPALIHNAEPRAYPYPEGPTYQPGVVKYLIMDDGRPRRASGPELLARGLPTDANAGTGWNNTDFTDAGGEWTELESSTMPIVFPHGFTGKFDA